jgi:hypothetical protein
MITKENEHTLSPKKHLSISHATVFIAIFDPVGCWL